MHLAPCSEDASSTASGVKSGGGASSTTTTAVSAPAQGTGVHRMPAASVAAAVGYVAGPAMAASSSASWNDVFRNSKMRSDALDKLEPILSEYVAQRCYMVTMCGLIGLRCMVAKVVVFFVGPNLWNHSPYRIRRTFVLGADCITTTIFCTCLESHHTHTHTHCVGSYPTLMLTCFFLSSLHARTHHCESACIKFVDCIAFVGHPLY